MALPTHIDPRKLALQGYHLDGEVAIEGLPRLVASVSQVCGPVLASVQFELDESKAIIATGKAEATVEVICQRCMDPVQINLCADFSLQVIWSEDQEARVAKNYEPWIVPERTVNFSQVLEDEVLLVLPLINYHEVGKCTGDTFRTSSDLVDQDIAADRNPFGILEQLKRS
jgi:uncharacterized protein